MTKASEDPLSSILRSKREVTRLQILVEIAEHQPAIRQQEIAGKLGVTPQAVSEYIRELVDDGMVAAHGRGRYDVTRAGIEWVLSHAEALEAYARHIRRDIIQQVSTWTAIAAHDLREGEEVGVYMKDGWLYAARGAQSATGIVVMDARKGDDVGVTRLSGIIDHTEGVIHVCKVPRVQNGGSRKVDLDALSRQITRAAKVGCLGIEALSALRKVGREPDIIFGAKEFAVEAAYHGLSSVIVSVDEQIPGLLTRLESEGLKYELIDLTSE